MLPDGQGSEQSLDASSKLAPQKYESVGPVGAAGSVAVAVLLIPHIV